MPFKVCSTSTNNIFWSSTPILLHQKAIFIFFPNIFSSGKKKIQRQSLKLFFFETKQREKYSTIVICKEKQTISWLLKLLMEFAIFESISLSCPTNSPPQTLYRSFWRVYWPVSSDTQHNQYRQSTQFPEQEAELRTQWKQD